MFWKLHFFCTELIDKFRYFCQKIVRGYPAPEAYDFFYFHAKYCIPRLKGLKAYNNSCPVAMPNIEAWHRVLDTMIEAFELVLKNDEKLLTNEEHEEIKDGLELFVGHYFNLWD